MKTVLIAAVALAVGFFGGFYVSNHLNREAIAAAGGVSPVSSGNQPPQTQAASIKEPTAATNAPALAGVQEALDKAAAEPGNVDAQIAAAVLFQKIRNFERAATYLEAAANAKPTGPDQLVKLANAFFDIEKYERAATFYEQALALRPNDIGARTDLGITFVQRAAPDLDRAIKEFDLAYRTDPKHEPTLYNLALAYARKGDRDTARRYYEELSKVNPANANLNKLAEAVK